MASQEGVCKKENSTAYSYTLKKHSRGEEINEKRETGNVQDKTSKDGSKIIDFLGQREWGTGVTKG